MPRVEFVAKHRVRNVSMSSVNIEKINDQFFRKVFNIVVQVCFAVILTFIILALLIGIYRLFHQLVVLWGSDGITGNYLVIISDVLTLFIMIELSRSLVDFFETHRFRITYLVDATLVFILREIMIQLFQHKMKGDMIFAMSALLLVLTALRFSSIYTYYRFQSNNTSNAD